MKGALSGYTSARRRVLVGWTPRSSWISSSVVVSWALLTASRRVLSAPSSSVFLAPGDRASILCCSLSRSSRFDTLDRSVLPSSPPHVGISASTMSAQRVTHSVCCASPVVSHWGDASQWSAASGCCGAVGLLADGDGDGDGRSAPGLDVPLAERASINTKSSVASSAGSNVQGCCSARPRHSLGARGVAPLGSEWPASQATAGEVGEVALDVSERGGDGVAPALQTCARLEQVLGLAVVSAAV